VAAWWPFGRKTSGEPPIKVMALGSCRVHDPLIVAGRLGDVDCLTRFSARRPLYLHDVREMIQFVRLISGEPALPAELFAFAFTQGARIDRRYVKALTAAECVVVEPCTDKHYAVDGHAFNVNELHRQIVEPAGEAGHTWRRQIDGRREPPADLIEAVEVAIARRRKLTDAHRLVLRRIRYSELSTTEIAEGLSTLRDLLDRPMLVVPHVTVRLADGSLLAERIAHVEKVRAAAHSLGLAMLDPQDLLERDGQERALGERGTDLHHYATDYLPVVGGALAAALRRVRGSAR
jgi:hypothetical protein